MKRKVKQAEPQQPDDVVEKVVRPRNGFGTIKFRDRRRVSVQRHGWLKVYTSEYEFNFIRFDGEARVITTVKLSPEAVQALRYLLRKLPPRGAAKRIKGL